MAHLLCQLLFLRQVRNSTWEGVTWRFTLYKCRLFFDVCSPQLRRIVLPNDFIDILVAAYKGRTRFKFLFISSDMHARHHFLAQASAMKVMAMGRVGSQDCTLARRFC